MYSLYKRIFKPVKIIIRRGYGRKEKSRENGPIWVIIHIYTWKCHNETPCVVSLFKGILNKQKCLFSKIESMKVKLVLFGGLVPMAGGRYKERVEKGECSRNNMNSCMKMEK
jgi:hypothetical protein